MQEQWFQIISNRLNVQPWQVETVYKLYLDECTIPFIARYRKDRTGNLNEQQIGSLFHEFEQAEEIIKRKEYILETIQKTGLLTETLKKNIENCFDKHQLEDLFLPYKPKRKTKATKAIESGLEPLAKIIYEQCEIPSSYTIKKFLCKDYQDEESVLRGAMDIVVEWINERYDVRQIVRQQFEKSAIISSKVIKSKIADAEKYKQYFDYKESLTKCAAHRFLAILRGKEEGFLRISITIDDYSCLKQIKKIVISSSINKALLEQCIEEAYKHYIFPSIENEFFNIYKQKADAESIQIFAQNLKQLLLTPPLGEKRILAIDPGFKTGCKIVCLDEQGNLMHNETIYPHAPQNDRLKAEKKIISLIDAYKIEYVAVGDGTASRETENFLKNIRYNKPIKIYIVSEAGASVYSASDIARQEFPQYDVTVRGAISIGRRLQDPLAELVKIEPKSIGVGQYQHDVDQKQLKQSLEQTVAECVNLVGVKINTASEHLLKYVSGIGEKTAKAIIEFRQKSGRFESRTDLLKVPRINKKIFEQAAGFLRIENSKNPLENTGIHPDHYYIVEKIASAYQISINQLIGNHEILHSIDIKKFTDEYVGEITLSDIINELKNPGYDVRLKVKVLQFSPEVTKFEDLKIGMVLNGIVTNITHFGAFINVGIKESGLLHISQICDEFIQSPYEKLHLHQHIKVKVIGINNNLKQFQLSSKNIE
ncbi:MAG: RNA-binding transcriptional accessory protein [Bacteroidales bacterium]|nr:RNA-binding transcriptional accessory protein [Bacteroidales bacterium]